MDSQQIKVFIDAMAASDLRELEVSHGGWTLRLVRGIPSAPPAPAPSAPAGRVAPSAPRQSASEQITAPMFGVIHLQPAPNEPPFVKAGDLIAPGQLLCTIEAMKVFNEVRAERGGRVAAILVASGAEVEAGQALATIEQVDPHV